MSSSDVALLVAGGLLLVAAVAWLVRSRRKHAREKGLNVALQAADPSARIAGLVAAAERGVNESAPALLAVARREEDEDVLDALAKIVAQQAWEGTSRAEAIELRLWARDRLRAQSPPATPPPDDSPAPPEQTAGPASDAGFRPAVADPVDTAAESPTTVEEPAAGAADPATVVTGPVAPPVEPASLPTVLVTGAGGPAGVCVIRALREMCVRVVAADPDDSAVGLQLADVAGSVPRPDDDGFLEAVCELGRATGAGALISTVSDELPPLAEGQNELVRVGLATWLPDPYAARICLDKWELAQALAAAEIPHPATGNGERDGVPGPWIVKPRLGPGPRQVYAIDDTADLEWALQRTPPPVVQSRLEGIEFTVDALVDRDGTLAGAVPRWRLETRAGVSTKGRTFEDPLLLEQTEALVAAIGLEGPVSVQGFLLSSNGEYSFTGVHPRFSSGLSLSLAAGADLVGEYLHGILGLPLRGERLAYEPGVTMERFYEEVILR